MHSVAGASALAASEGLPVAVSASSSSSLWVLAAAVPVLWTELWTRLWVRLPDCDEKYRPQSPHCWQTCLTRELTSRLLQQQGTIACAYCIVSGLLDARLRHSCRYLDKEGRGLSSAYSAYTRRPVRSTCSVFICRYMVSCGRPQYAELTLPLVRIGRNPLPLRAYVLYHALWMTLQCLNCWLPPLTFQGRGPIWFKTYWDNLRTIAQS